jgi:hypothetical protein
MERGQDDLQRRFPGEARMRVDRDAAPVIGYGDGAVGEEFKLDTAGVAGHRLVHRIVEDLGRKVVQGALVGAAHIHARPLAHRLQPFQDLDGRGVVGFLGGGLGEKVAGTHVLLAPESSLL